MEDRQHHLVEAHHGMPGSMSTMLLRSVEPVVIMGKSRSFLIGTALVALIGLLGLAQLLPLRGASNAMFVLRLTVEIFASIGLLYALVNFAGEPPAALGLRPFTLSTVGWALVCSIATLALGGVAAFMASKVGVAQNRDVLTILASRPIWLVLLIAAAAGIAEETVFRSVIISHVEAATGSTLFAAIASVATFALTHFNGWGGSQILLTAVPGIVLTLFFIWKRNLLICVIAHFLTDALGLVAAASTIGHHP